MFVALILFIQTICKLDGRNWIFGSLMFRQTMCGIFLMTTDNQICPIILKQGFEFLISNHASQKCNWFILIVCCAKIKTASYNQRAVFIHKNETTNIHYVHSFFIQIRFVGKATQIVITIVKHFIFNQHWSWLTKIGTAFVTKIVSRLCKLNCDLNLI